MKHLYFKHSNGALELIEKNVGEYSDSHIEVLIAKHVKGMNPDYRIPYFRRSMDILGRIWYDVGSYTESYVIF